MGLWVFMIQLNWMRASALIVLSLAGGCSGAKTLHEDSYNDPRFKGEGLGSLSNNAPLLSVGGRSNNNGDTGGGGTGLGVNAYLWRGALDTLSFMPLASADPFGGVIITDWYQPPAGGGERFKATAYILGRQLRADGVRVSVFRQVAKGGTWVDAPVSAGTASEIEDKVLARARDLRAQAAGS